MMNMAHLLATTMVELSSETWYELVNDDCGDRVVLFRPRIHADLAEISHMSHLGRIRTFRCDAKEAF